MTNEKLGVSRHILAGTAFWLLTIFGGAIPMLWNAISPSLSQYREGDLGYLVLQVASTPIGALIAIYAIREITKDKAPLFCMVNMIVAATALATTQVLLFVWAGRVYISVDSVGILLAAVVCSCGAVHTKNKWLPKGCGEEEQL